MLNFEATSRHVCPYFAKMKLPLMRWDLNYHLKMPVLFSNYNECEMFLSAKARYSSNQKKMQIRFIDYQHV
jgi:hypothetical protein